MALRYGHSEGHTDVCYSDNFKYIITCGSEGDVRIWQGVDDADQKDTCVGEKAWAVCQKENSLYVATDTNIIQAYTFPELETDGIITRFTAPATQIDVSADGRKLVASSCDMNIHVVDIQSLDCKKLTGHRAPVLSACIDPKSEYVASSSCDGTVRVWSLKSNDVVKQWDYLPKSNSFENSSTICRMHFHPDGRSLALPERNSIKMYKRETWTLTLSVCAPESEGMFNIVKYSPCGRLIAGGSVDGKIFIWLLENSSIVAKTNPDNNAICGLDWYKSQSIAFVNTNGQLGSLDIISPEENTLKKEVKTDELGDIPLAEPEFDDDDDDDENVFSLEKIKAETGFGVQDSTAMRRTSPVDDIDERSSVVSGSALHSRIPLSELQQPFQPSSTPVHLQQRFMAWNSVGIVRQFNTEDMNDIDVEFHDTSHHHSIRMNNVLGHTMAYLTDKLLILASPKSNESSSKLVSIVLNSWDGQKEWDISFGNENILLVAGGDGWAAAVTNIPTLHIFSSDGTQTDLVSLPGRPITMTGNQQNLCVFFHTGLGLNGDQQISYSEFRIGVTSKRATCVNTKSLPISFESTLRWVGYTDEGSLATLDTEGIVRILYKTTWRPICFLDNQCKSKFDHFFLVGINEYTQTIRCILCKGAFYPPVMPKPLVTEVKWQLPLCEPETDKTQLEEEYLRSVITLPNINFCGPEELEIKSKMEKSISVIAMKLFALACRSGFESRAVSLCEAMSSAETITLAAKYAAKLGKSNLAEKVSDVANKMINSSPPEEDEPEPDLEETVEESDSQDQPSPSVGYSQDMFEDSERGKENLILNMKKKKGQLSPKPFIMTKAGNPFRKSKDEGSSQGGETNHGAKYMEWYRINRKRLQQQYPHLKEGELILASLKNYRSEVVSKSSSPAETMKPPFDDTINSTINSSLNDSLNSESEEIVASDSKKRKLSADDTVPTKKLSTSSKLKSFSFSKR